jgi:hypothetical protein
MGLIGFTASVRTCRGCGCDDNHACIAGDDPCHWVLLDIDTPTGICSSCAELYGWDPRLFLGTLDDATEEPA